jgi:hypothetical protein
LIAVFLSVTTAGAPASPAGSFLPQAASSAVDVAVAARAAFVRNVRLSIAFSLL